MSRPDLQSVLEAARATLEVAPVEASADKDKQDGEGSGAEASAEGNDAQEEKAVAADAESEDEDDADQPWPPAKIRFTEEALGAAAAAARIFDAEHQPDGAEPEFLVEAAAIAALEAMKKQGKLLGEATIPKPRAASRRAVAAAAEEATKKAAEAAAEIAGMSPPEEDDEEDEQAMEVQAPIEEEDGKEERAASPAPPSPSLPVVVPEPESEVVASEPADEPPVASQEIAAASASASSEPPVSLETAAMTAAPVPRVVRPPPPKAAGSFGVLSPPGPLRPPGQLRPPGPPAGLPPGFGNQESPAVLQQPQLAPVVIGAIAPLAPLQLQAVVMPAPIQAVLPTLPLGFGNAASVPGLNLASPPMLWPQLGTRASAPTPVSGFIAKVEEGPQGERIFRYSLGPNADIEGLFRNVRRRIEVELEDGLTVQMCLAKSMHLTSVN